MKAADYEKDAGRLRHRVELQSPVYGRNDLNEQVITGYSAVFGAYAEVNPLSGRELWNAQQVEPDVTHEVTLRFRQGIPLGPEWRVWHRGRALNVLSVLNVEERDRWWLLRCVEPL